MAVTEHLSAVDAVPPTETASLSCAIKALAQRVEMWANSCADYYAAAAMYEQVSRLSNAELHRRELSRDTLGWHVCQSCDRAHR
jgi:hypothetical protein